MPFYFGSMMSILDKLAKIEALIQRASSDGEREAALCAKERVLASLHERQAQAPTEYKVSFDSPWKKRLFVALCRKHGLSTFRYYRQKYTTTNLRIRKNLMDEMLWPEFTRYATILEELVEDILQDLINKIHGGKDEETVIVGEIEG
jgi:hypothetical protein